MHNPKTSIHNDNKQRLTAEKRYKNVQIGKDHEKAQSEKDSHSKNEVGKNQTNNQVIIPRNISQAE